MNVCIIGNGLTSLSLAKNLANKKIDIDIFYEKKNNPSINRTLGISNYNFEFFKKEIQNIEKKDLCEIKKIEIYSEKFDNKRILKFEEKKKNLFFLLKNEKLYKKLINQLSKNKFIKKKIIKNDNFFKKLLKENKYDLIINCESNNFIMKKYFSKKIDKIYNNFAYTTILHHKPLENKTAIQIFTKHGPIAFLPLSNKETSVVYSLDFNKKNYDEAIILNLIKQYNPKFKIIKINKLDKFELRSSNLRTYYYKNIVAFGDCLHKVHPLAGQGFNMTIRDIKVISKIIQNKLDLGLQLDSLVFKEFEMKTKYTNFIFSNGIDTIYEFFNFDKKNKDQNFNKLLKFFGKNKILNNIFVKYADRGLNI